MPHLPKTISLASETDATTLRGMDDALAVAAVEAGKPCDMTPVWSGRPAPCSVTVRGPFFAGGLMARQLDMKLAADAQDVVSSTARYGVSQKLWNGPVALLVDGDTASAAELLAAMLQDAGRAVIVGSPTFGAGCGWMMEPKPFILPNSKGSLRMPDCSRFRASGTNEVDGITPDVMIGFRRYDTPVQQARRLATAWPAVFAALESLNRP